MKKRLILFVVFCLCVSLNTYSQITTNEQPMSVQLGMEELTKNIISRSGSVLELPKPDMNKVFREDSIRELKPNAFHRTGVPISVSFNSDSDGVWTDLPDGGKLWQLGVYARNAEALDFIFDKFVIPDMGKFFIFNPKTNETIGAITSEFLKNRKLKSQKLSTGVVRGDMVVLEYYQPREVQGMPIINASRVYYTYIPSPDFKSSCDNEVNVNCTEGANWQLEKNAVALVYCKFSIGSGWCSGALINNTRNDLAPLFLTANHCLSMNY